MLIFRASISDALFLDIYASLAKRIHAPAQKRSGDGRHQGLVKQRCAL
jgi:hypothetical protein